MNFKKWISKNNFEDVNFVKYILWILITKFKKWISNKWISKKGKSLVWEEKIVGAATIVADSTV